MAIKRYDPNAPVIPAVKQSDDWAITRGFKNSVGQAPKLIGSAIEGIGAAIPGEFIDPYTESISQGLKNYSDGLVSGMEPLQVPSYQNIVPENPTISDAPQIVSRGLTYAGEAIGQGMGSFVPQVAGMAAGGAVGAGAGYVTSGPVGAIEGGVTGMSVGRGASSFGQAYGEIYQALKEEAPKYNAAFPNKKISLEELGQIALIPGGASGALDYASLGKIMPKVDDFSQFVGLTPKEAAKKLLSSYFEGALTEGTTEAAQQGIQVGTSVNTFDRSVTANEKASIIDSAAMGALSGGLMDAGGQIPAAISGVRSGNAYTEKPLPSGNVQPNENALNQDMAQEPAPIIPAAPPVPNRDDLARMLKPDVEATTAESSVVQPETVRPTIAGTPEIGDTIEHVDQNGDVIKGKIDSIQEGENGQKTLIVTDNQGNQNIVFDGEGETRITDRRPLNRDDLLSEIKRGQPKEDVAPQAETQPLIEPDIAPQETPIAVQKQSKSDNIENVQAIIDNIRAQAKMSGWNGMLMRREQEALNQLSALKQTEINQSALEANPEPTEAQKQAGNYKKGHIKIAGLDIAIENAKGSVRSGVDSDGESWQTTMPAHYGYIKRSEGADGDAVDVYIGDNPDAQEVFFVDQIDPKTGKFDEAKVMIGFNSSREAGDAYKAAFSDGSGVSRVGAVHGMTVSEFKDWLKNGDTKKPLVYQEPAPQPAKTQEVKPKSVEPKPNTVSGMEKTLASVQKGIDEKNAVILRDILGNLDNKNSRKYFEDKTGIKLPKTKRDTFAAIDAFVGIDATKRQEIDIKKSDELSKNQFDKESSILDKRLSNMKMDTGESVREWIDRTIAGGHNKFVKQKKGNRNEYFLSNSSGNAFNLSNFGNPDVWKYAKMIVERMERDNPTISQVVADVPQPQVQKSIFREQNPVVSSKSENTTDAQVSAENAPTVSKKEAYEEAIQYPSADNYAMVANRKYGISSKDAKNIWNEAHNKNTEDKPVPPVVPSEPEVTTPVTSESTTPANNIPKVGDIIHWQGDRMTVESVSPYKGNDFILRAKKAGSRYDFDIPFSETDEGKSRQNQEVRPIEKTAENQPSAPENVPETPVSGPQDKEQGTTQKSDGVFADVDNGQRTFPEDNYRVDLSRYAPRIYRETSFSGAESYIPGIVTVDAVSGDQYADTANLAKGQGNNKGVLLAFNTDGITGQIKQDKPGLKMSFEHGEGEYFVRQDINRPSIFHKNLVGIRIDKNAKNGLSKGAAIRFKNVLAGLENNGFVRIEDDNYITYEKSQIAATEQVSVTKSEPTTDPQESATTEKPKDTIEDFGEKIAGAKKDLWKDYEKSIGDELPEDLKDITLSKHFPEPNYEVMIANGVTTDVLAAIKAMRDIIPSKPQKSWKLKEWASKVKTVRELSKMMLDGKFTAAEIKEKMNEYSKALRGLVERMELYSELGYPAFTKAKDWDVNRSDGVYENGKPLKGTFYFASYENSYGNRFDTRQQAVDFIRNKINSDDETKGKKEVRFDVFRITKTGEIVIGKKIAAGKFINLKGGFKTGNEARLYMANNGDEILALYEKKKDVPPERRSTNAPRRGEDYRKGDDVSVETLAKTFGFRGIQFGNYVEQKRRAEDINNAYDAMKDMATILGLPENALSLEGTLGLAFGARGGGNFAAAHYERGQTVINLTKKSGAGSLAHEWFHAFDHHFGKRRDGKDVYITESAYIPTKEIRKEVTDAFADIVKAIKKTGIVQRSESIDKTRTKDYWSTDIEMAARSFEAYIIYKAKQKDDSNDYLANVVGEEAWNASRGEDQDSSSYPYPTDKEMSETIAPAFDKLFDILETKDTDKGAVMFSLSFDKKNAKTQINQEKVDKIVADLNAQAKKLGLPENSAVLFQNISDIKNVPNLEKASQDGGVVEGFYYKNLIYIAMTAKDYISTLNHEAVHYLKAAGAFTPAEWSALVEKASKWRKKYNIQKNYGDLNLTESKLDEEAIAHALQDYSNQGILNRVRNKIVKYFNMVKNVLTGKGLGYKSAQDIFDDIMSGEIGRRRFDPEYDVEPMFSRSKTQNDIPENLDDLYAKINENPEYKNSMIGLVEHKNGDILINAIEVDGQNRGQGIGTKIMKDIIEFADAKGRRILLSPSTDFGATSVSRLNAFYKRFDFVHNRGKNKDFTTRETMIREPQVMFSRKIIADGLQSTLVKSVKNLKQEKGTGVQMLGILKNMDGVKEEEISWTGLDDFLLSKPTVSKQEIVDYLNDNQVKIDEVTLGTDGTLPDRFDIEFDDEFNEYVVRDEEGRVLATGATEEEARSIAIDELKGETKFSQYTLPNGENYREVLLTLPKTKAQIEAQNHLDELRKDYGADNKNYLLALKEFDESQAQSYHSSHFDQANILAHVRLNDRTDADGKKVLFVEEIQSDWAQTGRKRGFKGQVNPYPADYIESYRQEMKEKQKFADKDLSDQEVIDYFGLKPKDSDAVPSMPMSKSWHEMAFRRIVQMAAQQGYDSIAWTTGEQQNDRYDLSKSLEEIEFTKYPDGIEIRAYEKGNKTAEPDLVKMVKPNDLPDIVGKEIADKIIEGGEKGSFSGLDLKIGGDGMKGFYDNILVKYANKFGKKFGASVGKTKIKTPNKNIIGIEVDPNDPDLTAEERNAARLGIEVHSMDITPSMAKAADEGFAMFSILGRKDGKKMTKEEKLRQAIDTLDAGGLADKLRPSISKIASYILHPHQIASLYESFTPVYLGAIEMMKMRDVLVHKLSKNVHSYNKMNKKSKAKIDAVLEIGRLSKTNFKPNENGLIVVKNEGFKDTVWSKDGDEITLSDVEVSAYEGVRAAMDLSLDVQIQTTLEEYGFADMGIKTKKDLIAALAKEGAKELKSPSTIRQMQDAIKIINDIEDKKRKGYIPFKRWGEIGIIVRSKGEDAELTHFERVEIPSLAVLGRKQVVGENKAVIEAVKRLREKYPSKDFAIHPFEMKDFSKLKADINLTDLDVLKASSEMTEEEWDSLRGMLSEAMQKRGYKQHFLQSNDVSGYSADFERAINDYIVSVSGHLSRRVHIPKLDAAVGQIEKKGEASLFEYARKYVSYITDPVEEWSAMRQAVYFWYLAGNIASGVTNSSQPLMVTAPWFKAMFSHGHIAKQMSRAYKDTVSLLTLNNGTDVFDFDKAPDDVRDALIRAEAEGDFLPKNTHDAMAIADSNSSSMRGAGRRWRQVMDITSLTFSVPERANRVVTYISAYRFAIIPENKTKIMAFISRDQIGRAMLAGKNGSEFAEAFAHYAVISTQLRMGKLNRPTLSRGVGTLPFQFMSFSLQMLELMHRLAKVHGGKSATSIGMMLFAVVAMAGVKGIPFEDDLQKLFESAYKTMTRTDIDIDSEMLKLLTKYVGKTTAQAIVKGIPYAIANLDMSTRLGYGNITPDNQSDLLGVWFDMFWTKPVQASKDLARGEVLQAVADIMPAMIRNVVQGYLWSEEGVKSAATGDTIIPPEDVTKTDIGLKMLGFTSSAISGERNRIYAEKRASAAANELRSDYYDRLARAYAGMDRASKNKDKELKSRYESEIEAITIEKNTYNETAPLYKQIIINNRTLKQRINEELEGAKSNKPRKQARQEAEELKKVWGN